jgi:hypothetical protein
MTSSLHLDYVKIPQFYDDDSSENKAENTAQVRISLTLMTSSTHSSFINSDPQVGCAVFATFFYSLFEANLSEYGSYSLHIGMFRCSTDSHTNIRVDAKKYMLQRIFASEQIFA